MNPNIEYNTQPKHSLKMSEDPYDIVNGLRRSAILGAKDKMNADSGFGERVPFSITATWEKGSVFDSEGDLQCHAPPEIAKEVKYPTMNTFCPLISVGCFALVYMMQAAERDWQFESFELEVSADADLSCFYKPTEAFGCLPWKDGLKIDIVARGPRSEEDMKMLGDIADRYCPAVEILKREFPVEVVNFNAIEIEVQDKTVYYDMDKYKSLSEQKEHIVVHQSGKGSWMCHNESCDFPDALMVFEFQSDGNAKLALSKEPPMASGRYPNPVKMCFFGGLSTYLHTIAVRLYARGYLVKQIEGKIQSVLNNRMVMGVDEGRFILPEGAEIQIEVESDAPEEVVDVVQWEAQQMSPSFMNWSNFIDVQVNIKKGE